LTKKYIILKDDDVGKDFEKLKKWINIVLKNDYKGSIGLIGRYIKNQTLVNYLNSLDKDRIEIFCHGYSHSRIPFILKNIIGRNHILPTEFDKSFESHDKSLKNYRKLENKFLKTKAIAFGAPGNIYNENVVDALIKNGFKMMFSWKKVNNNIFTIPIRQNLKHYSLNSFIEDYRTKKNNDKIIFTLQFHHAELSKEQFDVMVEVVDFLKNEEKRIFINPSELLKISL
jgi:hypothetical protein